MNNQTIMLMYLMQHYLQQLKMDKFQFNQLKISCLMNKDNSKQYCTIITKTCYENGNMSPTKHHWIIDLQQNDLLFQGTIDGLTLANYWQKCEQQSHLLTIITLKNGNIFGGYSPCKLNKELQSYVVDNTNSSFIFQQNKQEIYKLKNKDDAIYCHQDRGPTFGGGFDFYVYNDFKSLRSNLGHSYDITAYNVQNNRTHLIGDKETEIIECKVYKITFL